MIFKPKYEIGIIKQCLFYQEPLKTGILTNYDYSISCLVIVHPKMLQVCCQFDNIEIEESKSFSYLFDLLISSF